MAAQSKWSQKTAIALADCSHFDAAATFRSGACLDGTEVVTLSDNGGVGVLFGSTIRARWANGQWSALVTDPVPIDNEPAYRPWLSPCGDRFFVSYRNLVGANPKNTVMALTIEAEDWARPLGEWKPSLAVGDHGFRALTTVPPPPSNPANFYDDMLLSDDGSHAVLVTFSGKFPVRLLEWEGSAWQNLEPPDPLLFVQWPGAWTGGQGGLTAPGEIAINRQELLVFPFGELGSATFNSFSRGAWTRLTGYPVVHYQMKIARDAARAVIGELQGTCSVWTGTDWVSASGNSAIALNYERTIGISADGELAVCVGDDGGGKVGPAPIHLPPEVSTWNGSAWKSQSLGDKACAVRDVAVAQNGSLAVVALTCGTPGTGAPTALPHVELATYRNGTWSLSALADTHVVPGIGSTTAAGPAYSVNIATAGPRVAVSADGTSALAVWGEPGGAYAAYYR